MYKNELCFAERLADAAAECVLKYFRQPLDVQNKDDASPVTVADKEAEAVMRDMIARDFPDCGIVGEEFGRENENAEFVWVLDPVDGTRSFITGKPAFGTLVALMHDKKPVLGVINQPYTKERWTGAKGMQTLFNGCPVSTRKGVPLNKAFMYSTGGRGMFSKQEQRRFDALEGRVALTRYSSDCYAYGLLSMGCIDIVCEAGMKLYDYAALVPVVEGAGGVMSDWAGNGLDAKSDGTVLALGDAALFPEVAEALK